MLRRVMDYDSNSEGETIKIAQIFANTLKPGGIVALYGDLGAGKSVFCRAIIRTLCDNPNLNVQSPTFSLLQTYELSGENEIYHFDFYRLENPEDIFELGWEEALSSTNIVLIEWPEKLQYMRPDHVTNVEITEKGPQKRRIVISDGA